MRPEGTCPKCRIGQMYADGIFSCNYRCDLCGYKEYRAKPTASDIAKAAIAREMPARRRTKRGGLSLGKIVVIILIAWLIFHFFF